MKVEKEVLIFRSKKELDQYVMLLTSPTSSVAVYGGGGAKYPATVDIAHTYGRKYDSHQVMFRKPKGGLTDGLKRSNRWKRLVYGFLVSVIAGFAFTIGCAAGTEFKDKQAGGKWDWIDFGLTVAGGLAGLALRLTIINLLGLGWLKLWI